MVLIDMIRGQLTELTSAQLRVDLEHGLDYGSNRAAMNILGTAGTGGDSRGRSGRAGTARQSSRSIMKSASPRVSFHVYGNGNAVPYTVIPNHLRTLLA